MTQFKRDTIYLPVFLALACLYFNDVLFNNTLLVIEDGFDYYYPMMKVMAGQYRDLIFPFWNPHTYSGFPLFASMEAGALYPFNVLLPLILKPTLAFNINTMLHYSLGGFFTFLYARQIGLSAFSSLLSGTIFSFLGFLPAHLNHQSLLAPAIWIPLLLFFIDRMGRTFSLKDALLAALVVALQFFAGHPQVCFYTYVLLLLYAVFLLFSMNSGKRTRFVLLFSLSFFLGLLLALPQLVASSELALMSSRAKATYEFFSSYPFPVYMITTFLFPFFYYYGGSQSGEPWGPLPMLGQDAFVGTLPFLVSLLVLTRWRSSPYIRFWGGIAILAFLLSLGDFIEPLNRLLYNVPVYSSFRAHSKLILLVSFSLSILTGFGISSMLKTEKENAFPITLATVLFLVITASISASLFFDESLREFFRNFFSRMEHFQMRWDRDAVPEAALSMTDPSIHVPILIMAGYLACVIALLVSRRKALRTAALSVVFLLVLVEAFLWKMDGLPMASEVKNYNRDLYSMLSFYDRGRTAFLTKDVSPLTAMPHGISITGGYEQLQLEDYSKIYPQMYLQPPKTWQRLLENNALLSMLNARFLVVSRDIRDPRYIRRYTVQDGKGRARPLTPGYEDSGSPRYSPIYGRIAAFTSTVLYENLLALPRAYAVMKLKAIDSTDELMRRIFSYRMSPWYEAALSTDDIRQIGHENFSPGDVRIIESRPNSVKLAAEFAGRGFLVLSDQFYPGWNAYIDGIKTRVFKTNAVMRGIVVPAGEHTVVFRYEPNHIYVAMVVSGIIFAGILLLLVRETAR